MKRKAAIKKISDTLQLLSKDQWRGGGKTRTGQNVCLLVVACVLVGYYVIANTRLVPDGTVPGKEQAKAATKSGFRFDYRECYDLVKGHLNVSAPASSSSSSNASSYTFFCQTPCVQQVQRHLASSPVLANPDLLPPIEKKNRGYRVLLNSPGGVGSTYVATALTKLRFRTNSPVDMDFLKHIDAIRMGLGMYETQRLVGPAKNETQNATIYQNVLMKFYCRLIYVVADPIHSVFSLYNRGWEALHWRKLCRRCPFPKSWIKNATAVFATSAEVGYDAWYLHWHAQQWIDLQTHLQFGETVNSDKRRYKDQLRIESLDRQLPFPPILITDIQSIDENPAILANFLGVSVPEVRATMKLKPLDKTMLQQRQDKERQILRNVGVLDMYLSIEREWDQTVAKNYLAYGIRMLCTSQQTAVS